MNKDQDSRYALKSSQPVVPGWHGRRRGEPLPLFTDRGLLPTASQYNIRGRGALTNRSGRFEANMVSGFDDGWADGPFSSREGAKL